jgi:formate--tetrahydrofolate ligase
VEWALTDVFERGGEGGRDLAEKVMAAAAEESSVHPVYQQAAGLETKVETVAREIYGASSVYFESGARKRMREFTEGGFGHLPVCIAKTQSSLSDNAKRLGAPEGWTLTVTGANLAAGAGYVVVIAGSMLLMPGLGERPQASRMDVDEAGHITGLR